MTVESNNNGDLESIVSSYEIVGQMIEDSGHFLCNSAKSFYDGLVKVGKSFGKLAYATTRVLYHTTKGLLFEQVLTFFLPESSRICRYYDRLEKSKLDKVHNNRDKLAEYSEITGASMGGFIDTVGLGTSALIGVLDVCCESHLTPEGKSVIYPMYGYFGAKVVTNALCGLYEATKYWYRNAESRLIDKKMEK